MKKGTTSRPSVAPGVDTGSDTGRTTITTAEADARILVSESYTESGFEEERLLSPMEGNDGIADDEIPDGILDAWDDDLSELPRTVDPDRAVAVYRPSPQIVMWSSSGSVDWEISPPAPAIANDPLLRGIMIPHIKRLESYAGTLASLQRDSILAPSIGEAVRRLRYVPKNRLAADAGTETRTASKISRDRFIVVEVPFGLVSLDFFTWASERGWQQKVRAIEIMDGLIGEDPTLSANMLGQRASDAVGVDGHYRKLVPALRSVQENRGIVEEHRRAFPLTSWQSLRSDLGRSTDDRAKPVMCLALAGLL